MFVAYWKRLENAGYCVKIMLLFSFSSCRSSLWIDDDDNDDVDVVIL